MRQGRALQLAVGWRLAYAFSRFVTTVTRLLIRNFLTPEESRILKNEATSTSLKPHFVAES